MLKATIGNPPRALILGISVLNLERLDDDPIVIFGDELGLDFDIMIQAGGSEAVKIPDVVKARDRKVCVLGIQNDVLKSMRENLGRTITTIRNVGGIEVKIVCGQDEATMAGWFEEMIGPETRVKTDKRLKN